MKIIVLLACQITSFAHVPNVGMWAQGADTSNLFLHIVGEKVILTHNVKKANQSYGLIMLSSFKGLEINDDPILMPKSMTKQFIKF